MNTGYGIHTTVATTREYKNETNEYKKYTQFTQSDTHELRHHTEIHEREIHEYKIRNTHNSRHKTYTGMRDTWIQEIHTIRKNIHTTSHGNTRMRHMDTRNTHDTENTSVTTQKYTNERYMNERIRKKRKKTHNMINTYNSRNTPEYNNERKSEYKK